MVLFIIITASILVLAVAGIALSQQVLAARTIQHTDGLEAAEAGLDAAVGIIRNANAGQGSGNVESLPCDGTVAATGLPAGTNGFTFTGNLDTSSTAQYTTTVSYWGSVQPTANNITAGTAKNVSCYLGNPGDYPSQVPYYALIISTGQDPQNGAVTPTSRTIEEIYALYDTNLNVANGVIEDFNVAVDNLCMTDLTSWTASNPPGSGSVAPASGDQLGVEPCSTAGNPDQTWEYEQNFTLELGTSGLCAQANYAAQTISLQTCSATPLSAQQEWGINDDGQYEPVDPNATNSGPTPPPDGTNKGPYSPDDCITEESNSAGSALDLDNVNGGSGTSATDCEGGMTDRQSWLPTPAVGPGDAGAGLNQFVNFLEFGNCMDVTNQDHTWPYLIDYQCKQYPNGAGWTPSTTNAPTSPVWNQRWVETPVTYNNATSNANGTYLELQSYDFNVSNPATVYCVTSPNNTTEADSGGQVVQNESTNQSWVTMTACPALVNGQVPAADNDVVWTVNASTTYWVQDYWSNCLETDTFDQQQPAGGAAYSTITVAACNATSDAEMWNAPPTQQASHVSNLFEPQSGN